MNKELAIGPSLPDRSHPAGGASSLERMLRIIDLFSPDDHTWTVEDISARLGISISTAYRYVRILTLSGLVAPAGSGSFMLGVKIIQLDRSIRRSDPLIAASRVPVCQFAAESHVRIIVSALHGDRVVCIHEQSPTPELSEDMRGMDIPIHRGATSKTILANLPVERQRRLLRGRSDIADLDWEEVRRGLRKVRAAGYALIGGEVNPMVTALAVPIFGTRYKVEGSLAAILTPEQSPRAMSLLRGLLRTAAIIGDSLRQSPR